MWQECKYPRKNFLKGRGCPIHSYRHIRMAVIQKQTFLADVCMKLNHSPVVALTSPPTHTKVYISLLSTSPRKEELAQRCCCFLHAPWHLPFAEMVLWKRQLPANLVPPFEHCSVKWETWHRPFLSEKSGGWRRSRAPSSKLCGTVNTGGKAKRYKNRRMRIERYFVQCKEQ